MLLAVWYDLSDVRLADALDDRASFRRFCDFSGSKATPKRTVFVCFRRLLVAHSLDRALFDVVTAQLTRQAITLKAGTITFYIETAASGAQWQSPVAGRIGATTGAGNGDWALGTDNTHPSVAGHAYLGARAAAAIKAAFGAAAA